MELRKPFSYQTKREFRQFIVRTKQILSLDILSGYIEPSSKALLPWYHSKSNSGIFIKTNYTSFLQKRK